MVNSSPICLQESLILVDLVLEVDPEIVLIECEA